MADELVPSHKSNAIQEYSGPAWDDAGFGNAPPPLAARSPLDRPIAAILRYKWIVLALCVLSTIGGFIVTKVKKPGYELVAQIMIAGDAGNPNDRSGPIRSAALLSEDDWVQLLESFKISDAVVRKLKLYVTPDNPKDTIYFRDLELTENFVAGKYDLTINRTRKTWKLTSALVQKPDSGAATDSVGRVMGLAWVLPPFAFANGTGEVKVGFTLATPRETSVSLIKRLTTKRSDRSNFITLQLDDENPILGARTLNAWAQEYVNVAGELKKKNLVDFAKTLDKQTEISSHNLTAAEDTLTKFEVHTITEPSANPVAAGVQQTENPAMSFYFQKRTELSDLKADRDALDRILSANAIKPDSIPWDALTSVPAIGGVSAMGQRVRDALQALASDQAKLTLDTVAYTKADQRVIAAMATVKSDLTEVILRATEVDKNLETQISETQRRADSAGVGLQAIPERSIEESRLKRQQTLADQTYQMLKQRSTEAQMQEAASSADVTVLDSATAPLAPSKDTATRIMLMAVLGGIAGAIGFAILLDKMDKRIRYPEQASMELGLAVAGTVPRFPKGGVDERSPEQAYQLVESFRSLRMNVINATGSPVSVAISSPSPADGKSLVSANLAMSFADAGLKTVLVDGDTRRGTLHETFGMNTSPGLTDYLAGQVGLNEIVRATSMDNLFVVACGVRQRRSPELLTSPLLKRMVDELRTRYDVVIFDTPPLAAGIDGYSIAAATGSLLVVLRVGETERRMAAAKLAMLERLPINVIGAVLNGVQYNNGEYEYYGYVPGYAAVEESIGGGPDDAEQLPAEIP